MKKWKVKFKEIIIETPRALLLKSFQNKDVWVPKKCVKQDFSYNKGVAIIMPEWLYKEIGVDGTEFDLYHRPPKIEPRYNQEAIDELKL